MTELIKNIVSFLEENGVLVNRETWYFKNGCNFKNSLTAAKKTKPYSEGVIIWRASNGGLLTLKKLQKLDIPIKFFVDLDKNKQGKKIKEIPILSPDAIKKDDLVIIGTRFEKEVVAFLKEIGCKDYIGLIHYATLNIESTNLFKEFDKVLKVFNFFSDKISQKNYINLLAYMVDNDVMHILKSISDYKQYFHPYVKPEKNDVIVDGGAYTGDTIKDIVKKTENECQIYAFEPDRKNFSILKKNYGSFTNITLEPFALWNRNTTVKFNGQNNVNSNIISSNDNTYEAQESYYVKTISIDYYFKDKKIKPTLIKMDIEGAELEALEGAENIIKTYKPKLQISIYHRTDHLWRIPLMLKEWVPEYKMFIGHHTDRWPETVLYCTTDCR